MSYREAVIAAIKIFLVSMAIWGMIALLITVVLL